ncbi:MAG: site-2 protease family protein [Actinomycetota bacterium]|nr:site-2 protease family protein [Actinomycetota bacterium]
MNAVGVLIIVGAILAVIMIHEAGHFLTAKAFDFKATKFFLGFGPTLWSIRRGETEYGVKAIPAGGFVKIVGMNPYEEVPPEDQSRSYPNKPRWQRALVVLAGPATHWVVAFLLLVATVMTIGVETDRATSQISSIQGVETPTGREQTAAEQSDLEPDDTIVAVDGRRTTSWREISRFIRGRAGQAVTFTVERDGAEKTIEVTLGKAIFDAAGTPIEYSGPDEAIREPKEGEELVGFLGVEPARAYEKYGLTEAVPKAGSMTWFFTYRSVLGVGTMFREVFSGDLWGELTKSGNRALEEDTTFGIVGFVQFAGDSFAKGELFDLMMMIVGFTVIVGLMNLLPLPPLDGGHLAVLGIEAATGEQVDVRKLIPIAAAVIAFFLVLFVAVLYLDIARPVQVDF